VPPWHAAGQLYFFFTNYACFSLTLRDKHRLRVFQKRMLTKEENIGTQEGGSRTGRRMEEKRRNLDYPKYY
jgi:hypothetical protein